MTSKQDNRYMQKMIYNKDSNFNSNGDASVMGLFKSTSSLARSLRQQCSNIDHKEVNFDTYAEQNKNINKKSLSASGKMIIDSNYGNQSITKNHNNFNNNISNISNSSFLNRNAEKNTISNYKVQSNPPKSMRNNIEIRNLTHFYEKIESHQETYELLFLLKSDKRMRHLDRLDEFEIFKTNFLNTLEDKIKRKFDVLQAKLKNSKLEIENQINKTDDELISLILRDVDYLQIIHRNILKGRQDDINNAKKTIEQFNQDSLITIDNYFNQLRKDLIDIGFMLDTEIEQICSDKKNERDKYFLTKNLEYNNNFDLIKSEELEMIGQSKKGMKNFILRWKNVKLRRYVQDLKDLLNSKEFTDNSDRYELIKNLKEDQEIIFKQRSNLVLNLMLKMPLEDISIKSIEAVSKELDEIYNKSENLFDMHTQKLMANSEQIYLNSLKEIDKFKEKIKRISYEFGKDNIDEEEQQLTKVVEGNSQNVESNESKDNTNKDGKKIASIPLSPKTDNLAHDNPSLNSNTTYAMNSAVSIIKKDYLKEEYKSLKIIEELIELEINPLIEKYKNDRKEFITKIIAYLDDYDEYINNNCSKIINMMLMIGTKIDAHKKNLLEKKKKFMLEMAKAADHNDDVIFEKEEILKKLSSEMKESFHKEDLDSKLDCSFNVINELEIEYREYFSLVENLLSSHENGISEDFHLFETGILRIFGINTIDKLEDITLRRNIESEFLSKKREQEVAQAELREQEEQKKLGGKTSAIQKKKPSANASKKKGEPQIMLVPPRPIEKYLSGMGYEYLVDFSIPELVKSTLRNIIYNRDDDILSVNSRLNLNKNNANTTNINFNDNATPNKDKLDNKAQESNKLNVPPINSQNNTNNNFFDQFNPYEAPTTKEFFSPISEMGQKLLSEENIFNEEFLIKIYEEIFNKLNEKIREELKHYVENAKSSNNEKREEFLTELDIRLKSLAPRKGKIEVEEYDKRLNEIEKHKEKYELHIKLINERNKKDNDDCNNLTNEISKEFDELNILYEKLSKVMDDETTLKSLDDKFKRFKTSYYDLQTNLQEAEIKMKIYTKNNPENLITLNKNFIMTLQSFEKGGTYSENEINFYREQIENINEDLIKKDMIERESLNQNKLLQIKSNLSAAYDKMEKKYQSVNENIQAKETVGKKFGSPKRLANDVIINIKMKCNQAQEGLDNLYDKIVKLVKFYQESKSSDQYFLEDSLPQEIRKIIISINNCVFNYGKYISAFKPELNYNLVRINTYELADTIELITKEENDEDEKRKVEELENLGYLSKFFNVPANIDPKFNKEKDKELGLISFISELNGIDEKVKSECSKIYVGDYAKLINNPEKIPLSLNQFLQNLKLEMESFRLKCVRDLRTYSQKICNFSCEYLPNIVFDYIFKNIQLRNDIFKNKIEINFKNIQENSEKTKQKIYSQLGPYLANPYYNENLVKIETSEELRTKQFLEEINQNQIRILENEEKMADIFFKRMTNNFEALTTILDNFIFEEEYISLDDEEYFKERKDYNTLLKLKPENKGNLNMDSRRTFKKIYFGLNRHLLKINYYEKYKDFILNNALLANDEEKIKTIKNEYSKENVSKSITALKLQTNKNLFQSRNKYYDNYCEYFSNNLKIIFDKFDKVRQNELDYKKRFNEILKSVKNTN